MRWAVSLIGTDPVLLDAAVNSEAMLADALNCVVAEDWMVFPRSLERFRAQPGTGASSPHWGPHLFVVDDPRALVGWGGFKGPPDADGAVEIGYAIAPSWRGRGVATDAVWALLRLAWTASEVRRVLAHTLPEPNASVRVLEKAGLVRDGENLDGDVGVVWRFRIDRPRR